MYRRHPPGFGAGGGGPAFNTRGRRGRQDQYNNLIPMLIFTIFRQLNALERKPPVTIALLAINIWLYLSPETIPIDLHPTHICLHPSKMMHLLFGGSLTSSASARGGGGLEGWIWSILSGATSSSSSSYSSSSNSSIVDRYAEAFSRMFFSAFVHADDAHLYYNMMSLLWKGINLESTIGTEAFLVLVLFSLILSQSLVVILTAMTYAIGLDFGMAGGYNSCAVGFSGVLFALKYVWNARSEGTVVVAGIPIPVGWACWVELVISSLVAPNVSFVGHLCGILAGMLYVHGHRLLSNIANIDFQRFTVGIGSGRRTRYTYRQGASGYRENGDGERDEDVQEAIRRSMAEQQRQQQHGGGRGGGHDDDVWRRPPAYAPGAPPEHPQPPPYAPSSSTHARPPPPYTPSSSHHPFTAPPPYSPPPTATAVNREDSNEMLRRRRVERFAARSGR